MPRPQYACFTARPKEARWAVFCRSSTGLTPQFPASAPSTTAEIMTAPGAQSVLKVNPKDYAQVLITRQQGRSPTTPGTTFLAGPIKLRDG